ncbi:MAG: hypothetical protein ABIQ31_25330 [Ferruginibacter sp.]
MSYENKLAVAKVLYLAILGKQHRMENQLAKRYKFFINPFQFSDSPAVKNEVAQESTNEIVAEIELQKTIDEKNCLLFNAFSLARPEIFQQGAHDDMEYLAMVSDAFFKFLDELCLMGKHSLYSGSQA